MFNPRRNNRIWFAIPLLVSALTLTIGVAPAKAADLNLAPDIKTASPTVFTDGDMAVDSSGRLYVASKQNAGNGNVRVYDDPASGTVSTTITGLTSPDGIAIFPDGSGIFIAEDGLNKVSFYYRSGSGFTAGTTITSGLNRPVGTWVSGSDLYVALFGGNEVRQYTINGTGAGLTLTLAKTFTGFNGPYGITVDSGGTLYVSEVFQARVKAFSASTISACGATCVIAADRTIVGAATLLNGPWFIETDGDDRLYIANFYDSSILIFDSNANGNTAPLLRVKGPLAELTSNTGMAVDSAWNFYSQNANSTGCNPLTAGCVQRWMRYPAQFSAQSSGVVESSQTFELVLTSNDGSRCNVSSQGAVAGTWVTLPGAKNCIPPASKPDATLLGWSTSPDFPVDLAQRQVDNGWGTYEIFNDAGRITAVFIPAGRATFLSGTNTLYAIWNN